MKYTTGTGEKYQHTQTRPKIFQTPKRKEYKSAILWGKGTAVNKTQVVGKAEEERKRNILALLRWNVIIQPLINNMDVLKIKNRTFLEIY